GNAAMLSKCIEMGKDDQTKQMLVFITVIKLINKVDQVDDVLKKIPIPTRVKKAQKNSYTPYSILAWKESCSHEIFETIANFLHEKGYSIFEKNTETPPEHAFLSLMNYKKLSRDEFR